MSRHSHTPRRILMDRFINEVRKREQRERASDISRNKELGVFSVGLALDEIGIRSPESKERIQAAFAEFCDALVDRGRISERGHEESAEAAIQRVEKAQEELRVEFGRIYMSLPEFSEKIRRLMRERAGNKRGEERKNAERQVRQEALKDGEALFRVFSKKMYSYWGTMAEKYRSSRG